MELAYCKAWNKHGALDHVEMFSMDRNRKPYAFDSTVGEQCTLYTCCLQPGAWAPPQVFIACGSNVNSLLRFKLKRVRDDPRQVWLPPCVCVCV